MGVGQLSESDAVDALRLPFYSSRHARGSNRRAITLIWGIPVYSSSHPTGSHGWRNQFDLGNPRKLVPALGGFLIILLACGAETPNVTPVGTIAPTPTPTPRVIVVTTAPTATPMPSSTPVPTTMPTPTQRVVAADTPVPTITSEPTVTPEPTATAAPAATPIPTPTVTPVPPTATPTPPPLGSRQNPVQLGTEVDVKNADDDHWRIAVIDTVPDATRLVLGENPFNNPPKEGFRFYIVTIRVQYLGPDSTSFGGSYRLKALGIGGVVYTTFRGFLLGDSR